MVSRLDSVQSVFSQELSILDLTRDQQNTLDWLYQNNLLKRQVVCPKCSMQQLQREREKTKADQMRYRCPVKSCRKTVSIRIGSIFEDSKLTLIESTRLIFHYFLKNVTRTQVLKELSLAKNTVTEIYSTIRECISVFIKGEELSYRLGDVVEDPDDVNLGVEIDESLFSHLEGNQV